MVYKIIELLFVFFSKIYIFFYKEKGDYWFIFPIIIMSGIIMINVEVILLLFFSLNKVFPLLLLLPMLLFFAIILRKKEYNWVLKYTISRNKKILISSLLIIDFIIMIILLNISRSIYIATHL